MTKREMQKLMEARAEIRRRFRDRGDRLIQSVLNDILCYYTPTLGLRQNLTVSLGDYAEGIHDWLQQVSS